MAKIPLDCVKPLFSLFLVFLAFFWIQVSYAAPTLSSSKSVLKNSESFVYVLDIDLNGAQNDMRDFLKKLTPETMKTVEERYQEARNTLIRTAQNLGYVPLFDLSQDQIKSLKKMGVQKVSSDPTEPLPLAWDAEASVRATNLEFTNYLFQDHSLRKSIKHRYSNIEALLKLKGLPKALMDFLAKVVKGDKFKEGIRMDALPLLIFEVDAKGYMKLGFKPLIHTNEIEKVEKKSKASSIEVLAPKYHSEIEGAMKVHEFLGALDNTLHKLIWKLLIQVLHGLKEKQQSTLQ